MHSLGKWLVYAVPLACLALLVWAFATWLGVRRAIESPPQKTLLLICSSTRQLQIEAIAEAFQRRSGVRVEIIDDFGIIPSRFRQTTAGVVFLADSTLKLEEAVRRDLIAEQNILSVQAGANDAWSAAALSGAADSETVLDFIRFLSGPVAREIFESGANSQSGRLSR